MSINQTKRTDTALSNGAKAVPQVKSDTAKRGSHFILKGEHMRLFIMAMLVIPSWPVGVYTRYFYLTASPI